MTHIVLALVWLASSGHHYRADIAVTQRDFVSTADCQQAARRVYAQAVLTGVIPSQSPTGFRATCTTEL